MVCSRGAASPDAHTQKRLFAASAGYCQNPGCEHKLFLDIEGKSIHIAEMAHVFAASDDGPRKNPNLSLTERGSFENLIMLCPTCHRTVDKASEAYPDTMMLRWKRDHANKLSAIFGVKEYTSRAEARRAVNPLLMENLAIFNQYGPHIEGARDPESGAAERWKRKMLTKIIPNNRRILILLDKNHHLLDDGDIMTTELFRQHIDDLESFHIEKISQDASQFPISMTSILKD